MNCEDKVTSWTNLNSEKTWAVMDLIKRHIGTDFYNSKKKKLEEKECNTYIYNLIAYTLSRWEDVGGKFL